MRNLWCKSLKKAQFLQNFLNEKNWFYLRTRTCSSVGCWRLLFAGHCLRAENEIISLLLLWKKNIPIRSRRMTYPQMLSRDTGIGPEDLSNAMLDRDLWKTVVQNIPASGAEGWWWSVGDWTRRVEDIAPSELDSLQFVATFFCWGTYHYLEGGGGGYQFFKQGSQKILTLPLNTNKNIVTLPGQLWPSPLLFSHIFWNTIALNWLLSQWQMHNLFHTSFKTAETHFYLLLSKSKGSKTSAFA